MKKRFLRFSLVGLLGVALQLSLIALLTKCFGLPIAAATALAVEMTLIHNFLWHERFTWPDRARDSLNQRALRLWRFHLANGLVSLIGNTALTYCFVQHFHAPPLPSALAAIALCSFANFTLADRWIYES